MNKKEYEALEFELLSKVSPNLFESMSVIKHFQTPSLDLTDDDWSSQIQTVLQAFQQLDFEKAERVALEADLIDGERLQYVTKYLLGIINLVKNELDTATSYFQMIIKLDSTQSFAYYYLAICQLRQKQYKIAFDNLLYAKQAHSDYPPVDAILAVFYTIFRKYELSQYHASLALNAKAEVANELVSLSKFQADYYLGENLTPTLYPFDLGFFNRVSQQEATELLGNLPTAEILYQSHFDPSVLTIFICSDSTCLNKYVLAQILSVLKVKTRKVNFHLHIINPNKEELLKVIELIKDQGVGLTISAETTDSDVNTIYYSSIGLCRFYQYSKACQAGAIFVGSDVLFKECPYTFELSSEVSILNFEDEVIWQQVSATVLHVLPSESSLQFLANVSALISKHLISNQSSNLCFLEQIALFNACQLAGDSQIGRLAPIENYYDLEHSEKSFIWVLNKDEKSKFNHYKKQLDEQINMQFGFNFNKVANGKYGNIIVNVNDQYIGQSLLHGGTWCQHEIDLVSHYLKSGDTVVDAGANYGAFTLPLAKLVGNSGEVYAFEPQRLVHQALCGTLALNSLVNVKAFHSALSDRKGSITVPALNYNESNNFGGLSLINSVQGGESVQCMTIDQLNLPSLTLLKADVEGMELFVLKGAKDTISRFKPILYLENHACCEHYQALISYCRQLGYQLYWHGPTTDRMMLGLHKDSDWPVPRLEQV